MAAVLALVAIAAAGCSKRGEQKAQPSTDAAAQIPAVAAQDRGGIKPGDGEGFDENAAPRITGPVSFADAEAAYESGNYAEATRLFEHYTTQKPTNPWGHYMLGLSAWKGGDPAKAEQALLVAQRLAPTHVKTLVNLSRVLIEQKRFDDAVAKLTEAGGLDPQSADVSRLLGRVFSAQHKTDDAIDAYRKAIALDGNDAWSMNNLGLLFIEEDRADEAVPLLAKAVMLKQDVPVFHNNLGMALEHTGRFAAAAVAYSGAMAADPNYVKAKQNLARVDAMKKDVEEPFDLEVLARGPVEDFETASDETSGGR
jgi:Flp pilus assembly protein TadD